MTKVITTLRRVLDLRSSVAAVVQTLLANVFIVGLNFGPGIITARLLGAYGRGELAAMILWPQFLSHALTLELPGPLEVVRDGQDALVVAVRDSGVIGRALQRMITDTGLLDRLRRNAYAAAQGYNWSRIARQTIRLYEEFTPNPKVLKM